MVGLDPAELVDPEDSEGSDDILSALLPMRASTSGQHNQHLESPHHMCLCRPNNQHLYLERIFTSTYKGINMVGYCPVSSPVLMSFHQSEFDC